MHLGLIGYGNIARVLASLLKDEPVTRLTVLVRPGRAEAVAREVRASCAASDVLVVETLDAVLRDAPDIVVECAGQGAVETMAGPLLEAGLPVVVASIGALADDALRMRLERIASSAGGRLILPAGAIGGIDLLAALAPAGDLAVSYEGRKPPGAWAGTPAESQVELSHIEAPMVIFEGDAREAARTYPKNANVAATLALAGAGFEATKVTLVADPEARGNIHRYSVASPLGRFSVEIENAASTGNAKTSVATVYSLLREINRVRRAVVI